MLLELWLPIILSGVAVFFTSFLSWMIVQLHKQDWIKMEKEDDFLGAVREIDVKPGSYMFPGYNTMDEMKSEEFTKKSEAGPVGILTVFPSVNMGRNLGLTFLLFVAISFCLAYLATLGLERGAAFLNVFRFVATAALLAYLSSIVQHAIWFRNRIVGHVIESIAFALITGAIFGAMWPSAA